MKPDKSNKNSKNIKSDNKSFLKKLGIGNNRRTHFGAILIFAIIGAAIVSYSHAFTILGVFGSDKPLKHPGIQQTKAQLDFVKTKVSSGQQPWKGEYDKAMASRFAKTNYIPSPVAVVSCSSASIAAKTNANGTPMWPQSGCAEQVNDSQAAYTQALLWYYSGNEVYAKNAINILNAWAYKLTEIKFDQPRQADGSQVYNNGHFQAGWAGINFVKAAEIMRYTYKTPTTGGWSAADIAQQEASLKQVYYPLSKDGWSGGQNRQTTLLELNQAIGVFTNDRVGFLQASLNLQEEDIKVLIYLKSDGALPAYPKYKGTQVYKTPDQLASLWTNPTSYANGIEQETCRDLGHMMMGMGSIFNMAETAKIQGLDLYGKEQTRLTTALEFNAAFVNAYLDQTANIPGKTTPVGWAPPNYPCPSFSSTAGGGGNAVAMGWEVGYNHYSNRLKLNLPQTTKAVNRIRTMTGTSAAATRVGNQFAWEILTAAGTP